AYIVQAADQVIRKFTHSVEKGYPGSVSRGFTVLTPLLGGNLLTGFDYAGSVVRPEGPSWLVEAARWSSRLIYPLIWAGIGISIRTTSRMFRSRHKHGEASGEMRPAPLDITAAVVLAGLVLQGVIAGMMRVPPGPQYFLGTFALHAFMAWLTV